MKKAILLFILIMNLFIFTSCKGKNLEQAYSNLTNQDYIVEFLTIEEIPNKEFKIEEVLIAFKKDESSYLTATLFKTTKEAKKGYNYFIENTDKEELEKLNQKFELYGKWVILGNSEQIEDFKK